MFAVDVGGVLTLSEGPGLETWGLEPGGMVGRSAFEAYAEQPLVVENLRRALSGEAFDSVLEASGTVFACRYGPLKDNEGAVVGAAGVAVALRGRERGLEEESPCRGGWFARFVERSADLVMVVETDGRVRYVNAAVERLLGYSSKEFAGLAPDLQGLVEGIVHPDDLHLAKRELDDAAAGAVGPRPPVVAVRVRHRAGSWRRFEGYVNNLVDDPEVGGLVFVGRDVTERVRAEEEARRLRERLEARTASLHKATSRLEESERALEEGAERYHKVVHQRVLRDLHDTAKQSIIGTCMLIEACIEAQDREDPTALGRLLKTALEASREAKRDLSETAGALLLSSGDVVAPSDFFTERVRKFGKDFDMATHVDLRAPLEALGREELAVAHRACVEACWNVAKHASAENLWLSSRRDGPSLILEVRDDGCGFAMGKTSRGMGIGYMRSRATEVGAILKIDSAPERGTAVRLRFGGPCGS